MTTKAKDRKKERVPSITRIMNEMHCQNEECKKFLGYELMTLGLIEIQCHACNKVTQVTNYPDDIEPPKKLTRVICGKCGRFLYGEGIYSGKVSVKCQNCHTWNTLDITPEEGVII